jgi:hypothetical protein
MIDWHHSLIHWHHSSNTLTFANQIRKAFFVKQKSLRHLHARCTRSAQITWFQKRLRSLLSWSSAFETCKNDSKRATFDVIIKSEIRAFLRELLFLPPLPLSVPPRLALRTPPTYYSYPPSHIQLSCRRNLICLGLLSLSFISLFSVRFSFLRLTAMTWVQCLSAVPNCNN